jgi:signal transduction histidine kinase
MKNLSFSEIVDIASLQRMSKSLYCLAGVPIGLLDVKRQEFVVKEGWQRVCIDFHRKHPETCQKCLDSDNYIQAHLNQNDYIQYKCKNGMWDCAVPLVLEGEHLATVFVGQFFYIDEDVDEEFFRQKADEFGFNPEGYLKAIKEVPRFSREQVKHMMHYYEEQVSMMASLGLAKLKAEASNRLKTAFVQNISHEIRTPLNSIVGFSDVLNTEIKDQPVIENLTEIIVESCNRLTGIVDSVMSIAQIEAGTTRNRIEAVSLREISEQLNLIYQSLCERKGIQLKIKHQILSDSGKVYIDKNGLWQIVNNLMNNAIKFTEKGNISCFIEEDKELLKLTVSDSGKGISPKHQAFIFERFWKAPGETQYEGVGLGLAIVKEVVERLKGRITYQSSPDHGATFQVELPLIKGLAG